MTTTPEEETMTRTDYELGRSDGVADGSVDFDWNRERIANRLDEIRADVRRAFLSAGRRSRAYVLGYARGYREATR
jgi:hypothetical protein